MGELRECWLMFGAVGEEGCVSCSVWKFERWFCGVLEHSVLYFGVRFDTS